MALCITAVVLTSECYCKVGVCVRLMSPVPYALSSMMLCLLKLKKHKSLVEPILVLKDFDLPDDVCCNICRSSWTRLMQIND